MKHGTAHMRCIWMRNTHCCRTRRGHGRRSWRHRDSEDGNSDLPILLMAYSSATKNNRCLQTGICHYVFGLYSDTGCTSVGVNLLYRPAKRCRKTGLVSVSGKIPCDNAADARGCAAHGNGLFTITGTTENRSCLSPFHQQEPCKTAVAQPRLSCWETWFTCGGSKWKGAGGQSLLLKEGQRLEGTFVNNAGGWGSITGKRTAACENK